MSKSKKVAVAVAAVANAVAGAVAPTAPVATVAVAPKPSKPARPVRSVQNGVKHPLPGGKCYAVWELCSKIARFSGAAPTTAAVTAHAVAAGWNPNNTTIELSYWRKYHGVPARAPKA